MQLKVVLPTGEVNVPVEPNSTPGHLKENLKYSLRVPPKQIRLTCDGRELDDIKPLSGEPNNVTDGAVIHAEPKEGVVEEEAPKVEDKPVQQTIIKKEESPKPKKPRKEEVRPAVGEKDVVKKEVLAPGYQSWTPKYLEGKQAKRHLAFLRVEAVDEKKKYPEQQEGYMALALGDPHTSPAWTAAATQMDVGEKALFSMSKKVVDFDPEGLNPTDSSATWTVELLRIVEVDDVLQDFTQLLHIESSGGSERAQDLDNVAVHWRVRRWMAEGMFCIASSRERIAIMPGYGLVPIEDPNAPPVNISVGEGQQEAVELISMRVGVGGKGHLYLKSEALKGNRPSGCVVIDVDVVGTDSCRGPGSPGWKGWQSLVLERETADQWLEEADARRKQLETFGTLRKSTTDSKGTEAHVAEQVHKFAHNSVRRYRRALRWLEADEREDRKIKLEKGTMSMRLSRALALSHRRFGDAAEGDAPEDEKKALIEAKGLLKEALEMAETMQNESLSYECLKSSLQIHIQAQELEDACAVVEKLEAVKQDDEELKSDKARINRMRDELTKKKGAGTLEELRDALAASVVAIKEADGKDVSAEKAKLIEDLGTLMALMKENKVTYDACVKCKVGKEVGNAIKLGDPELAKKGREIVSEIQALAQRNAIGV